MTPSAGPTSFSFLDLPEYWQKIPSKKPLPVSSYKAQFGSVLRLTPSNPEVGLIPSTTRRGTWVKGRVVAKVTSSNEFNAFARTAQETRFYKQHVAILRRSVVPEFLGLYGLYSTTVLVLEDVGVGIKNWNELNEQERYLLLYNFHIPFFFANVVCMLFFFATQTRRLCFRVLSSYERHSALECQTEKCRQRPAGDCPHWVQGCCRPLVSSWFVVQSAEQPQGQTRPQCVVPYSLMLDRFC
jgi:hypothetical protein